MRNESEEERMGELLMQRTTGALSAPEADALAQALPRLPQGELARWEHAAAELAAALAETDSDMREPLPAALAVRIIRAGEATVRAAPRSIAPVRSQPAPTVVRRFNAVAASGWLAAAAALVLWFVVPRAATPSGSPTSDPIASATVLRDSLIRSDSAAMLLAWTATKDSSALGASGDVVWSARTQRGVMRIAGLQVNDRRRWQYQLWIFDRTRNEKYPVDGGVFDIPPGQREVLVPIDARVPVGDAVMFAVTVEPAGGVVVSTRERIALLAQRGG